MENKKLRGAIAAYAEDNGIEEGVVLLTDHSYDNSIVGITEDGRAIYDFDKMVEEYAADENCEELEAIEWIEYNTMRALPYAGERCPIIIHSVQDIVDRYGE